MAGLKGHEVLREKRNEDLARCKQLLESGDHIESIMCIMRKGRSTIEKYKRELMDSGQITDRRKMRNTSERQAFIKANETESIDWMARNTGMSRSTIVRDLRAMGRTDIKRNKSNLGHKTEASIISAEFGACRHWNAIFKSMTTKQGVQL